MSNYEVQPGLGCGPMGDTGEPSGVNIHFFGQKVYIVPDGMTAEFYVEADPLEEWSRRDFPSVYVLHIDRDTLTFRRDRGARLGPFFANSGAGLHLIGPRASMFGRLHPCQA